MIRDGIGLLLGVTAALLSGLGPLSLNAQELEPRLLSNAPVGMNFALVGYGLSRGNILLDPAIPIDDVNASLHTFVGAFVHTFGLFGMASKVDVVVPWASGDWTGKVEGRDSSRSVSGLGDPRVRLSVTFVGAPALQRENFSGYRQETVVGASLQVIAPLGQYDPSKLINLGANRWTARALLGMSRALDSWIVEGYLGTWVFGRNDDFFGGNTLDQKSLFTAKTHLIRLFDKGRWLAFDAGYGLGGRTIVEGAAGDTRISTLRFGVTFALPISAAHSVKFTAVSAVRLEKGPDYDALGGTYQYRW